MEIVPAGRWREWMNATNERMANRCLPLLVANESGWELLNPVAVEVTWDGRAHPDGVTVDYGDAAATARRPVSSDFGYGVVTWGVPFLFRTPPGWNLLARGPANRPKDAIAPLEGLVETDWAIATFTMNWKLTRPGQTVRFEAGEPFCLLQPQRRGELESFEPSLRDLKEDPHSYTRAREWTKKREELNQAKFLARFSADFAESWSAWQQHYFRGHYPDGDPAPEHETKRRLRSFESRRSS